MQRTDVGVLVFMLTLLLALFPSVLSARKDAKKLVKEGDRYATGDGVSKDLAKAAQLYREAAELGNPEGQTKYGSALILGEGVAKDYAQALTWIRKAADQGFPDAEVWLGSIYSVPYGVPKDYEQAMVWNRKAAQQGDAVGQLNLGTMYLLGQGVAVDYGQALIWIRKAADGGVPTAQFVLGQMYAKGGGVPVDYEQAAKWYRKAIDQLASRGGYPEAEQALAALPSQPTGTSSTARTDSSSGYGSGAHRNIGDPCNPQQPRCVVMRYEYLPGNYCGDPEVMVDDGHGGKAPANCLTAR